MQFPVQGGGPSREPPSNKWSPEDVERETLVNAPGIQAPQEAQRVELLDRRGLTTVYAPPPGQRVNLDIIFIHNIRGGSHSSWMTSWMKPADVFWPAAVLPLKKPNAVPPNIWPQSIRIQTYGYPAWEAFGTRYSIPDLGAKLLETILDSKELAECSSRIVFVCERFGGLVAKAAFTNLEKARMDHKILESRIASVIFFETMHWARAREKSSSMKLYEAYESDARVLRDLQSPDGWTPQLDWKFQVNMFPFDIFSIFYSAGREVNSGGGAVMGLISETPIRLSRPQTPKTSISREAYGAIFDSLAQTAYRLTAQIYATDSITWNGDVARMKIIADYLGQGPGDPPEDQLRALSSALVTGSASWLLEEEDFRDWRDGDPRKKVLWFTGAAGWGKTHLSAYIVNYLRGDGHNTHAYFFPFDDKRKQTPQACLLSFAYQRATISQPLQHALIRLKNSFGALESLDTDALARKLFTIGILDGLGDRTFFVIDSLDTCLEPNELLDAVVPWCSSTNLRVLILSHIIESMDVPEAVLLPMQPKHARYVVGAMLASHSQVVSETQAQGLTALVRRLEQRSLTRSPLWASLVIQKLNECHSDADFNFALLSLPESAEVFYQEAIMEVKTNGSKSLNRLLDMIAVLNWPIEVRSLTAKIVKKFELSASPDPMTHPMFPACNGLLKMDARGQLRFAHKLARDMLRAGGRNSSDWIFDEGYVHNLVCRVSRMDEILIKSSELQSLLPKAANSTAFKTYLLLNIPSHLVRMTGVHQGLVWLKDFLMVNMVAWVSFLTQMGRHVLQEVWEDMKSYYDMCSSDRSYMTSDEKDGLRLLSLFIASGKPEYLTQTTFSRGSAGEAEQDAALVESQTLPKGDFGTADKSGSAHVIASKPVSKTPSSATTSPLSRPVIAPHYRGASGKSEEDEDPVLEQLKHYREMLYSRESTTAETANKDMNRVG